MVKRTLAAYCKNQARYHIVHKQSLFQIIDIEVTRKESGLSKVLYSVRVCIAHEHSNSNNGGRLLFLFS